MCGIRRRRREEEAEADGSKEPKTRSPQKDVGKNASTRLFFKIRSNCNRCFCLGPLLKNLNHPHRVFPRDGTNETFILGTSPLFKAPRKRRWLNDCLID